MARVESAYLHGERRDLVYRRGALAATPGPPGPAGPPGPPGPPGRDAVRDVLGVELPYDGDVTLPPGVLASVVQLALPAGVWLASATVALVNRGAERHRVDVWLAPVPPPRSYSGPRAAQLDLEAGGVGTLQLGPAWATLEVVTQLVLVAQRDASSGGPVLATEATDLVRRAGATGVLAWGVAS
ncbi:MAG TPA: hypothetical protein VFF43_08410 [Caldimonas sp.]|nr:hypothetical protein [Caldimonas sp.]